MENFELFIINTHQVFIGLLLLSFVTFFVVVDGPVIKENWSTNSKKFLLILFPTLAGGLFLNLLGTWGEEGFFFAVEFSILIILSIINPKYAISFLVFLLLSRPWETYDNQLMASMSRDVSYLAMISIVVNKLYNKNFYIRFNMGTFLIIAFGVWLFLSAFFSNHQSLGISKFMEVFTKAVIVFILIQNSLETEKDAVLVKLALIFSILEKGFISFYQSYMTPKTGLEEVGERLQSIGFLSNSNDIAAIFVLVIPLVVYFILKSKIRPFNWIFGLITFISLSYLVWESQSRGAVLAIAAIIGAWFFLKINKVKYLILVITFAVVGGLGVISLMNRSAGDLEGSTSNRIIFWKAGANMAIRNPIFGVGYWGFNDNFSSYAIDGDLGTEGKNMTAHSSWVLALSEGGFMSLGLFVSLWGYSLYRGWLMRKLHPEYFLAIVGYGVAITFLSHTYLLFPYIILSLVVTHSKLKETKLDPILEYGKSS